MIDAIEKNQYIKIKSLYINNKIGIFKLVYLLWSEAKPFGFYATRNQKHFQNIIKKVLNVLYYVSIYIYKKVRCMILKKELKNEIIETNVFGHFLLYRENKESIKVFDLEKKTVTTKHMKENETFIRNIENLKLNNNKSYSNKLIDYSIENGYCIENYVNSPHLDISDWGKASKIGTQLIKNLIINNPIKIVKAKKYINELNITLPDCLYNVQNNSSKNDIKLLEENILSLKDDIIFNNSMEIPLVFSHGDIASVNIIFNEKTENSLLIDWEWSKYRTVYFDFYYIHLLKLQTGKQVNYNREVIIEIKRAIKKFKKDIKEEFNEPQEEVLLNLFGDNHIKIFALELIDKLFDNIEQRKNIEESTVVERVKMINNRLQNLREFEEMFSKIPIE